MNLDHSKSSLYFNTCLITDSGIENSVFVIGFKYFLFNLQKINRLRKVKVYLRIYDQEVKNFLFFKS